MAAVLTCTLLAVPGHAEPTPVAPTVRAAANPIGPDFPDLPASCPAGPSKICRVTRYPGRPFLVLWGDSHAMQYLAPVTAVARNRRINLVLAFMGLCPPSLPFPAGSGVGSRSCDQHNLRALEHVRSLQRSGSKVRVVVGGWWSFYRDLYRLHRAEVVHGPVGGIGLSDYLRHTARLGVERSKPLFHTLGRSRIRVDVIAQSGTVPFDAPPCAAGISPYRCDLPRSRVLPDAAGTRRFLRDRTALLGNRARVIDPSSVYCGPTTCRMRIGAVDTFADASHLGLRLTRRMKRFFAPSFSLLVEQPRPRR